MPYTNDFFRRAGACSRRHFIRTAEDVCPYSEKTSVCFLSYQKSVAGATRQVIAHTKKRCGGPGHSRKCPGDFFASFSALEKEVTHLFFACAMRFPVRSGRNAYYIFEHAAEIIHVVIAHHSRNFAYRNIAVRKQFRGSLHS